MARTKNQKAKKNGKAPAKTAAGRQQAQLKLAAAAEPPPSPAAEADDITEVAAAEEEADLQFDGVVEPEPQPQKIKKKQKILAQKSSAPARKKQSGGQAPAAPGMKGRHFSRASDGTKLTMGGAPFKKRRWRHATLMDRRRRQLAKSTHTVCAREGVLRSMRSALQEQGTIHEPRISKEAVSTTQLLVESWMVTLLMKSASLLRYKGARILTRREVLMAFNDLANSMMASSAKSDFMVLDQLLGEHRGMKNAPQA